jgi:hypothetical protein
VSVRDPLRAGERGIEILAVLLLGVATIGSAWCGYQATQWNGRSSDLSREQSEARVEGARVFGLATQLVFYDATTTAQLAQAIASEDEALAAFLREALVRPEFAERIREWEEEVADSGRAPANLLTDQAYLDAQFAEYRELETAADALGVEAREASDNADQYVLTTLLLAAALFFAGVTTSFRIRVARVALLAGSALVIAYAAATLAELPTL